MKDLNVDECCFGVIDDCDIVDIDSCDRVDRVDSCDGVNEHSKNAIVFKALCDPKRLAILEILRKGEHCACDIIEITKIAQSALSYHMKILLESALVESRQVGKWTYYKISNSGKVKATILLQSLLDCD